MARDVLDEFVHIGDCKLAQLAFGQFTEEPLDQIEPGGRGSREMEMDPVVAC